MTDLEPFLTFDVKNAILAHMLEGSPKEICGMITSSSGKYSYEPAKNIHKEPDKSFAFTKAVNTRVQTSDKVVAYVHSHPVGPAYPSKRDMEIQALVGKPSVIATLTVQTGIAEVFSFGDHLLDLPLNDREFRYGVTDCYEAIRSWRWQHEGVKMIAKPRHNGWWNASEAADYSEEDLNLYTKHYASQGYTIFEPNFSDASSEFHPKFGDLLLMKLGATLGDVVNHAGIYIGNNLIYHHRIGKKSGETPVGYLPRGTIRAWARQGLEA